VESVKGDTVKLKGGGSVTMSPISLKHLLTDKPLEDVELKAKKIETFQAYVLEAFDQLGMTIAEYSEGFQATQNTLNRKQMIAVTNALGIAGRSGTGDENQDFTLLTYQDIIKNIPASK